MWEGEKRQGNTHYPSQSKVQAKLEYQLPNFEQSRQDILKKEKITMKKAVQKRTQSNTTLSKWRKNRGGLFRHQNISRTFSLELRALRHILIEEDISPTVGRIQSFVLESPVIRHLHSILHLYSNKGTRSVLIFTFAIHPLGSELSSLAKVVSLLGT